MGRGSIFLSFLVKDASFLEINFFFKKIGVDFVFFSLGAKAK